MQEIYLHLYGYILHVTKTLIYRTFKTLQGKWRQKGRELRARVLGVARQTINNLVNEKAGISAEMAVRLSKAFGPSPDMWVRLQANYDLSQVRQDEIAVARYKRAS